MVSSKRGLTPKLSRTHVEVFAVFLVSFLTTVYLFDYLEPVLAAIRHFINPVVHASPKEEKATYSPLYWAKRCLKASAQKKTEEDLKVVEHAQRFPDPETFTAGKVAAFDMTWGKRWFKTSAPRKVVVLKDFICKPEYSQRFRAHPMDRFTADAAIMDSGAPRPYRNMSWSDEFHPERCEVRLAEVQAFGKLLPEHYRDYPGSVNTVQGWQNIQLAATVEARNFAAFGELSQHSKEKVLSLCLHEEILLKQINDIDKIPYDQYIFIMEIEVNRELALQRYLARIGRRPHHQ